MKSASSWLARRRLDRSTAALGLVAAVCIFPLQFVVSHVYATTLPLALGLSSILYLVASRSDASLGYPLPTVGTTGARTFELLVLVCTAVLFVYGGIAGKRTELFYALGGVTGSLLFFQLLFVTDDDLRTRIALVEVVALAFVVRFVGLYGFAGYIGIDVWSHMAYVEGIRTSGSLAEMNTKYVASPLYHLLAAVTADLTGLPNRGALYLSSGVVVAVSIGFVYYAARQFTPQRWALFAAAMYAVSGQVIRWGLHVTPTSLGVAFFAAFFVHLIRLLQEYNHRDAGMVVFLVVAITLTHQLSAFVALVVLLMASLFQLVLHVDRLAPEANPVNVFGLLTFTVGFITLDWSLTPYAGESFTTVMLLRLRNTIFRQVGILEVSSSKNISSTAGEASATLLTKVVAYLDVFGFLALLFVAALGGYHVLKRPNRTHARTFQLGTIAVMAVFVLALPILGVSLFLPGRWYAFMYVPMAVVGVIGLRYVTHHLNPKLAAVGLAFFVLVFPGLMLISGAATPDSPVFDSKQTRLSFTETEVDAVRTIDDVTTEATPPIYTDAPYTAVFLRTNTHVAAPLQIPRGERATNELVVYRTYQSQGAPLISNPNRTARVAQVSRAQVCSPTRSQLYANGEVSLCRQPNPE